jgi:urease subunit gamma
MTFSLRRVDHPAVGETRMGALHSIEDAADFIRSLPHTVVLNNPYDTYERGSRVHCRCNGNPELLPPRPSRSIRQFPTPQSREYCDARSSRGSVREDHMQLTPREFDKLLVYMMAEVALKRKANGLKLNHPEAVAIISAVALDGARAGKTIEEVTKEARTALTKADVMEGVGDLIPMVQIEAVFTDGSRLVTVHTPIQ